MFSGKGDRSSGRGKSLLKLAEEQIARRRASGDPRAHLDQIAFPDVSILTDAEKHRRARAKRERVNNPLLGELGNRPERVDIPELPEPPLEPKRAEIRHVREDSAKPAIPSVLDQFAKIDADLRIRAVGGLNRGFEESSPAATASSAGFASDSQWRPLVDPRYVFDAIRRLKGLLVLCTALGAGLGTIQAISTEKLYYSTAEIKVDPRGLKVIDNGVNPDGFLADSFAVVDSQLGVIRSPTVLEKVVEVEGLAKDPEFNGDRTSGWLDALAGIFGRGDAASDKTRAAAKTLGERVYVERGAKTYNITITAGSEDPEKAARIAGKIVEVYVAEQRRQQSDVVLKTSEDLAAPLAQLEEKVKAAEKLVEKFKTENDLIGVDGRMIDDESILRVNDQLSAAKGQTIAANARAKSAKEVTVKGVVDGAVPEELNSTVLNTLRGQFSIAKQKLDGMATRLGSRHPERIQAETELDSIRASIDGELRRVSAAMQTDLKRAIQTEQDLAARLAELKNNQSEKGPEMITLRELQRDLEVKRSVYDARRLRADQAAGQVDLNTANISLAVPPRAAEEPVGPSRKLIVLAGAIAGFALGLALAVLKGIIDSLRGQAAGATHPDRAEAPVEPAPNGGGGGGMFQPRPATSVSEEVRNTLNALKARTAPAMERTPEPVSAVYSAPAPQPAQLTPAAMPAQSAPITPPAYPYPSQPQPSLPQQWPAHPAFQQQHFPHPPVQPGPMMYPHPVYAPQQPAFVPQQPVFVPQPPMVPVWQQPMPQMVQMPIPSPAQHPFAHEAASPASQAPQPAASPQILNIHQAPAAAPADQRLDDIQRSIEEFRSALTDFARRRTA